MSLRPIQPLNTVRRFRGFTIVELVVAMSVAAILVGVAVPAFVSISQNQRRVAEVSDLVVALNYARSEAVKQNTSTGVSVTANGAWNRGWTVCCTLAGAQVSAMPALDSRASLTVALAATTPLSVAFTGSGAQLSPTGTVVFTLCDARGHVAASAVEVSPAGRIQAGAKAGYRVDQVTALTCPGGA
jgi:prepilin-type N-terminal cleavage/methylation domain-containing protein